MTDPAAEALAPCPFHAPATPAKSMNMMGEHFVLCECGAHGPVVDEYDSRLSAKRASAAAIAAWNRRAPAPADAVTEAKIQAIAAEVLKRTTAIYLGRDATGERLHGITMSSLHAALDAALRARAGGGP